MQVSQANNVKVYNLSSGNSLPEWLSERKRRELQKQDIDVRRRIELIQDFSMPTASTNVQVTKDGEYILATGVYKPRMRCYDVSQLSLKFERCFDSDAIKMEILSDDFSKVAFLQNDRYIEFHAQYGRYYRTRMPNFGRDLAYHSSSCDLYLVGTGPEVFRLNLEQGRYLQPFETNASQLNVCEVNPVHELLAVGTEGGEVVCFDPRSNRAVGSLDTSTSIAGMETLDGIPSVTALAFKHALCMGVGLSNGQILLYDIRANKPFTIKDHFNDLPIQRVSFHSPSENVLSADSKVVKIWNQHSGKIFTSIEPEHSINDFCQYKNSGLLFMAGETEKMGVYYIPSLGEAPRWCSFLDNLTEELEESDEIVIYDDYKFVTKSDLESLGLSHLIGTNFLRAYMHGYFIDVRLYNRAKVIAEPFAYEQYRKSRIRQKLEEERSSRIRLSKLPTINRQLAERLIDDGKTNDNVSVEDVTNPLADDRFSAMFKNPDFQINEESEEYRLLHPVVSKKEKERRKKRKELASGSYSADDSSDDELKRKEMNSHKIAKTQKQSNMNTPKLYEVEEGQVFKGLKRDKNPKQAKLPSTLGELVGQNENDLIIQDDGGGVGAREVTFALKKSAKELKRQDELREHVRERRKVRRSTGNMLKGKKSRKK